MNVKTKTAEHTNHFGYEGDVDLFCEEDAPEGYILKYQHCIDGPGAMQASVHTHIAYFVPKPLPTLREAVNEFLCDSNYSFNSVSSHKHSIEEAYDREGEEG